MTRALLWGTSVRLSRACSTSKPQKITAQAYGSRRRKMTVSATNGQKHRPCIVLSNDDGCDFPLITSLYHELRRRLPQELEVVICAPAKNQSAASHRITLGKKMLVTVRRTSQSEHLVRVCWTSESHVCAPAIGNQEQSY
eukprot:306908-Prorocentrum_minimum.AAC.4